MQKVYNDKKAHVKKLKTWVKLQVWNKKQWYTDPRCDAEKNDEPVSCMSLAGIINQNKKHIMPK